jgi:hypothetical protein
LERGTLGDAIILSGATKPSVSRFGELLGIVD